MDITGKYMYDFFTLCKIITNQSCLPELASFYISRSKYGVMNQFVTLKIKVSEHAEASEM